MSGTSLARPRQRGISLIEALVAVAIMGFGLLGLLGLQSSLRANTDLAKQRSTATRVAQELVEQQRVFSTLAPASSGRSWDAISSIAAAAASTPDANAVYTASLTVVDFPTAGASAAWTAPYKQLRARVDWVDRNGETQRVNVDTLISATAPEVQGALAAAGLGSPVSQQFGREARIPPAAIDLNDGTSRFSPPGAPSGVSWIFNNTTGNITRLCSSVGTCIDVNARLLSGYISFALSTTQPTVADAEIPPSLAIGTPHVEVSVAATAFTAAYTQACFEDGSQPAFVAYYCAMLIDTSGSWSGVANVTGLTPLASTIADSNSAALRICRYTSLRSQAVVGPLIRNDQHPQRYSRVSATLANQNFLVIRAGDGGTAFDCPDDDTATPLVNGRTWHHQPMS